ncbi:hypothetical protein B0T14DRAFT_523456 [Immersiella caudata]|uniref:Ankyrin repeat domain-containing protein n=1 Tax=Immersiella caudata TaxID=314043 RepID=A0AA39WJJ2_9PEZI|nr:hypothetical protein B0T14DRAFT_523456 [Immersiella caudata]
MWNPVLRAILNGRLDVLRLLVEHKADLNRHNPLVAVDRFHTERAFRQHGGGTADEIVDFLLQQGVDIVRHGEEAMVSSILRKRRLEDPYAYLCDCLISRGNIVIGPSRRVDPRPRQRRVARRWGQSAAPRCPGRTSLLGRGTVSP